MRAKNKLMAWVVAASFCMAINAADYEQTENFGNKSPGDVISFTVTPPGTVLTGNVTAAGGFVWTGGPAAWNGTIPGTYAGVHSGAFDGTWSQGGEGEGKPLTWHVDTTAVVISLTLNHNLWWFNGEKPPKYKTSATLTAKGAGEGAYKWKVTAGKTKVDLNNGGADADIINANDDNTVTVKSTAASAKAANVTNDVTISLTYNDNTYKIDLPVFAPDHLQFLINLDTEKRSGYASVIMYSIRDQFDIELPHKIPVNEDIDGNGAHSNANQVSNAAISDWTIANGKPNNEDWQWGAEDGGLVSPGAFVDIIVRFNVNLTPVPLWPTTLGANAGIDHSPKGAIYVGSKRSGKGIKVKALTWTIYRGFARHK